MDNNPLNSSSTSSAIDPQVIFSQLAIEFLREQRRARWRRWGGRILMLSLIVLTIFTALSFQNENTVDPSTPHVGLIDVKGTIFDEESAGAEDITKSIEKAYSSKGLKALILRIDSPGGSPVQADYIYNALTYYKQKHSDIKVYAVCVDMCASAAYYVAAAADEIYANPSSMIGSIGVLYNGFGFVDTLQKIGVSRRLQTAGRNKGFMDQFSPIDPAQTKLLQNMLDIIHQEFINKVKAGRGSRLLLDDDTFSGLFWTGTQAKQRGLIDGFASAGQLARDTIKIQAVIDYTYKENAFEKMVKRIGVAMVNDLPTAFGIKPGFQ